RVERSAQPGWRTCEDHRDRRGTAGVVQGRVVKLRPHRSGEQYGLRQLLEGVAQAERMKARSDAVAEGYVALEHRSTGILRRERRDQLILMATGRDEGHT